MKRLIFTALLAISMATLFGQTKYHVANINMKMDGTSTLHNWHMTSTEATTDASFLFSGSSLIDMPALIFSVPVETFKSGTKGLNKNAYKALNSETYPNITFASTYTTVHSNGDNTYAMKIQGNLTVNGVTNKIIIPINCKVDPATQNVSVNGTYKISMSSYKVDAPTFMFGAMKTGDEVTVTFDATLNK